MKKRYKIAGVILGLILSAGLYIWAIKAHTQKLETGDLIFQTSRSGQSLAIVTSTGSLYSHMGIVIIKSEKAYVVEASAQVKLTPLDVWINHGIAGRYTLYRFKGITERERRLIMRSYPAYLGRPYDIFFLMDDARLYCSELPYKIFRTLGHNIGKIQKIKNLNVDNGAVQKVIESRWEKHPLCQGVDKEICTTRILDGDIVTPVSISQDPQMELIFDNYSPF